ncbi:hypothetical protein BDQ17DRAFT_941698 [Cyathus striatus]|nr:hypothetical protein BDQ17DRAFT_941698 [Cyathus striatus]
MLNIIHDENVCLLPLHIPHTKILQHTTACLLVSYHAQPGVTVYLYTHASKILPSEGGISLMDVRVAVMLEFMFLAKVALGKGYEWSQDEELEKSATPPTWKKFEEVVTKYSSRNKVAADIPHKAKVASPLKLIPLPSPPPIRNSNSSTPLTQAIFEEYIYPLYERGWGINFIPSDSGKRIPVLKRHFRLGSSRKSSKLLQTIALVLKDENHTTPHISISILNHEPTITVLLNTNAKAGITLLDVRAAVILENRFREKYKWEAERGDEVERDEGMEWEMFKEEILERPRRGMRSEWDVRRVEEGVLGLSVLEETAVSERDATSHHTLPSTEDNPPQEKEAVHERALPESSPTGSKISTEDIPQSESVTPSLTPTEGIPLTYRAGMFERAIPPPPAPDEYLPPMNDLDLSLSPDDFDPFLMEGMLSPQTPLSSTEHARSPLPDKPLPTEKDIPEPPEPAPPSPKSSLPHPPSTERYKGRWPWINQTVFEEYMFPLYERRWNMRLVPGDYPVCSHISLYLLEKTDGE